MPDEPHSAFRTVPRTGVIYVTTEAQKRGYSPVDADWCNLGQGQPDQGRRAGAQRAGQCDLGGALGQGGQLVVRHADAPDQQGDGAREPDEDHEAGVEEVDDSQCTLVGFSSGVDAFMETSYHVAQARNDMEIYGTEGSLFIDRGLSQAKPKITLARAGKDAEEVDLQVARDSFVNELEHFCGCIRGGKTPITDGREARKSMAAVFAAYRSSQEGRRISLPQ